MAGSLTEPTGFRHQAFPATWKLCTARAKQGTTSEENLGYAISNYPNPFNQVTTIEFSIPKDGNVRIGLYNAIGKRLEVLTDREYTVGTHEIQFDVENLSVGTYFIKFESNAKIINKAIQIVR